MAETRHKFYASRRMEEVQSPVIPIVADWIRQNPGTISLGQGVVSYGPPPHAFAKLNDFRADPENHKYKTVEGLPALREALAQKLHQENRIHLESDRALLVTAGSNMGFINALLAITDPGDEVILQTPYYFNHEMAIGMAGCRAVIVETDANFQPRPEALALAVTEKTRAIVTISPNNPTGAVYPEAVLRRINRLCRDRGVFHIHDEAYEYFIHGANEHFSPGSIDETRDATISLYSLSKAYGFASWRIGYMVVPVALLESVRKIQDTILICPPVISQYAAQGALEAGRSYCLEHIRGIQNIRSLVLDKLRQLEDICEIPPAEGAFYVFLRLRGKADSLELTRQLIERYRVAVMPGSTFGMTDPCCLRIAYGSLNSATVEEGLDRFIRGLRDLA